MGVITQVLKAAGFREMNKYNPNHDTTGKFASGQEINLDERRKLHDNPIAREQDARGMEAETSMHDKEADKQEKKGDPDKTVSAHRTEANRLRESAQRLRGKS